MKKNYENDFNLQDNAHDFVRNVFDKVLERNYPQEELDSHLDSLHQGISNNTFNVEFKDNSFDIQDKRLKLNELIHGPEFQNKLKQRINQKEKRKYAIQISGHFRDLHKSADHWASTLNQYNNQFDIFIHTWNHSGKRSSDSWIDENEKENRSIDVNYIIDIFKPKRILIENPNCMEELFILNTDYPIFYNTGQPECKTKDFSFFIMSQLYSIYKANELRKDYEKTNNINYKLVFKVRADTYVNIQLNHIDKDIIEHPDNILYINSCSHSHPLLGRGCAACCYEYPTKIHKNHSNLVCDLFYYGTPTIINKVSSIYLHINELLEDFAKHNLKLLEIGNYNHLVSKRNNFNSYTVHISLEDLVFKCCFPERFIIEFLKDEFLLDDIYNHIVYRTAELLSKTY